MGGSAPLTRYRLKRRPGLRRPRHHRAQPRSASLPGRPEPHQVCRAAGHPARCGRLVGSRRRRQAEVGDEEPLSSDSILEAEAIWTSSGSSATATATLSEAIRLEPDAARRRGAATPCSASWRSRALARWCWRWPSCSVRGGCCSTRSAVRWNGCDRSSNGSATVTVDALADTDTGAAEVRGLAADFNGLTRSNQLLQEQQAAVLLAHQLALDVARVVHGAPDLDTALEAVVGMLGEGLGGRPHPALHARRDRGDHPAHAQWHRYDLPDLPVLPPSLAGEVKAVGDRAASAGHRLRALRLPRRRGPGPGPCAALLPGDTDAKSLLMVPVGHR